MSLMRLVHIKNVRTGGRGFGVCVLVAISPNLDSGYIFMTYRVKYLILLGSEIT